MTLNKSLVWFRRDLRAFDHAALHHALTSSNAGVLRFYLRHRHPRPPAARRPPRRVSSTPAWPSWTPNCASWAAHLIVRQRHAREAIPALAAELGVDAVFANHDYEPRRDRARRRRGRARWQPTAAPLLQLQGPGDLREGRGADPGRQAIFRVHALQECLAQAPGGAAGQPGALAGRAACGRLAPPPARRRLPSLAELGFDAGRPGRRRPAWPARPRCSTTSSAHRRLRRRRATSRPSTAPRGLSVHLRFGTISIRHLVRTVQADDGQRRRRRRRAGVAVGTDLARVLRDDPVPPSARGRARVQAGLRRRRMGIGPAGRRSCSPPGAKAAPATRWWTRRWRS